MLSVLVWILVRYADASIGNGLVLNALCCNMTFKVKYGTNGVVWGEAHVCAMASSFTLLML